MLTWREVQAVEDTSDRQQVGTMHPGIPVYRQSRALIALFPDDGFKVLSSGFTNGGFVDSPESVANIGTMGGMPEFSCMFGGLDENDECALDYAARLGLDPRRTVCMCTAANMVNAVITNRQTPDGIGVSTAITAGILHNGGRSGDPATYDESADETENTNGTIVILLSVDAQLSDMAMVQALMIATEAKTSVVQELQARSLYSPNIATGSGTDQVAVIIRKGSKQVRTIDRNSDLAMTISGCVRDGLRKAFDLQSGMDTELQSDVMTILSRYGLTQDVIRNEIRFPATMKELLTALDIIRRDRYTAAMAAAVLEIQDEVRKGVVDDKAGLDVARRICVDNVIGGYASEVERIRLESAESIPEMVSYLAAVRLMRTVEERRSEHD
ncbi:MAG: hypothetical protein E7Z64_00095 [Thermoplasmata archaeon]|jgi:adenosylcobinamide amidohydrolase|nr:hypothetical protein [Thermoplasmata archaeon]